MLDRSVGAFEDTDEAAVAEALSVSLGPIRRTGYRSTGDRCAKRWVMLGGPPQVDL